MSGLSWERLKNETHESRTDPGARLMRKGKGREARLSFMGHALMENGNGLLMDFVVSRATGRAERDKSQPRAERAIRNLKGLSRVDQPMPRRVAGPWSGGLVRKTWMGSYRCLCRPARPNRPNGRVRMGEMPIGAPPIPELSSEPKR